MSPIRSATAALTSAVLATTLTACQFGAEEQDTSPIIIAADLELSGPGAPLGKTYQRALELKAEQLNSSGALNGRQIELRIKDNRSDASESLRNVNDFSADSQVSAIVMGGCNECAMGAVEAVNGQQVPMVALASAEAIASPATERRYVFRLAPSAPDSAEALAVELRRNEIDTVGVLRSDDAYGKEGLTVLEAALDKADIEVLDVKTVRATDTDVSSQITALAQGAPEALVLWARAEQAGLAAVAAREANFEGALYFDASAAGELFLGTTARAAENATMVFTQTLVIDDVIATTPAKAARRQWFQDYTARFGGYHGSSSFAADALQLLTDAAIRSATGTGTTDREGIRNVLETSQLDGLSGPIRLTPDNHSGLMPQALTTLVARNGRWHLAG
ncbi:ABC transporter substrate-binding protein [Salinispora fenicalii]|uniref:ABC transporter substrate-binding protein n=1 Tax=Salinispora fenicalii TaxID=1137263 RepID=UPI00037BC31A|nr:ABC transporter substrate-binding protein [Salinispora fenicalii]